MIDTPNQNPLRRTDPTPITPTVSNGSGHGNSELNLRDVILFFWRNSALIMTITTLAGLAALASAFIVTPTYTADVTMLPVTTGPNGLGVGSKASGLGSLASFVGINVGSSSASREEAIATLKSRILTERFIEQNSLLPVLFSSKWNKKYRRWNKSDVKYVPTLWNGNRLFKKKIRKLTYDPKTGLITLAVNWKDPIQAAQWANGLVALTNSFLKEKAINRAQREIAYLNNQLQTTNIVSVRNGISDLLDAEIRKEMIAKGRHDFSLRVIDPAAPPQLPSSPRKLLWSIGGILGGFLFALILCASKELMHPPRPAQPHSS